MERDESRLGAATAASAYYASREAVAFRYSLSKLMCLNAADLTQYKERVGDEVCHERCLIETGERFKVCQTSNTALHMSVSLQPAGLQVGLLG